MKELTGGMLLAFFLGGCSGSVGVKEHRFDYQDVGLLKKCFVEVVRKHYAGREDGELSDPTATGMRLVFNYHKPVDGAHSEMADLVIGKRSRPGRMPGTTEYGEQHDVFKVVVHRARSGTDPVLKEDSARLADEIRTMMASERGGAEPR